MRFSVSNIALPAYDHARYFSPLREMGFTGVEVAPSRVWRETGRALESAEVSKYRKSVENAGLTVVGLHSLFFDHPELGLFKGPEVSRLTLDYLVHHSEVCRDLGGKTLIFGSPTARRRGNLPVIEAEAEVIDFFGSLCDRISHHGTCFCLEPLAANESDFVNSAIDAIRIANAINDPSFQVQLDAKALTVSGEVKEEIFLQAGLKLVHYHVNEPGLGVLGSGAVDHQEIASLLRSVQYNGFVSLEQRMLDVNEPLNAIRESVAIMKEFYS